MSKTLDTALLSLSAGCLVISIYEIMVVGLSSAYFWMMLCFGLWLWYGMRKRKRAQKEEPPAKPKPSSSKPASKKTRKRR